VEHSSRCVHITLLPYINGRLVSVRNTVYVFNAEMFVEEHHVNTSDHEDTQPEPFSIELRQNVPKVGNRQMCNMQ